MNLSGVDNPLAQIVRQSVPLGVLPLEVDFEPSSPKHFAPRRIGPMEIRTGKLGAGTVAWLDYKDLMVKDGKRTVLAADPWRFLLDGIALTPFLEDDDLYYDYYFSILGKLLYQVAGKKTAIEVRGGDSVVTASRQSLPGTPVRFKIAAANKNLSDLSVLCEIRDRDNRVVQKIAKPLVLQEGARRSCAGYSSVGSRDVHG